MNKSSNFKRLFFFFGISFLSCTYALCQKTSNVQKLKDAGRQLIDSISKANVDTLTGYLKYGEHVSNPENLIFKIIYKQGGISKSAMVIQTPNGRVYKKFSEKKNGACFNIINNNKDELFKTLNSSDDLFNDTIKVGNGMSIREGISHGITYFIYLKVKKQVSYRDFCCEISLNNKMYYRAYSIWLLISAFNEE